MKPFALVTLVTLVTHVAPGHQWLGAPCKIRGTLQMLCGGEEVGVNQR
jgi:hypothetical protein